MSEDIRYFRKWGWASSPTLCHLVIRGEAGGSPLRTVCGVPMSAVHPTYEPKPQFEACLKCMNYSRKRGWA